MTTRRGEGAAGVLGGSDLQPQVPLQPPRAEGKGRDAVSVGGEIPQTRGRPHLPHKQVHRCVGDGGVVVVHSFDLSGAQHTLDLLQGAQRRARAHLPPHGRALSVDRVCVQEGQRSGRVGDAGVLLLGQSDACGTQQP